MCMSICFINLINTDKQFKILIYSVLLCDLINSISFITNIMFLQIMIIKYFIVLICGIRKEHLFQ